jgi:hypothetical protein
MDLLEMASQIESEIRAHPLPPDDEFFFGADLLLRYLRALAAVENHRALRIAKAQANNSVPPTSTENDFSKSESKKKYEALVRTRLVSLRALLTSTPQQYFTPPEGGTLSVSNQPPQADR